MPGKFSTFIDIFVLAALAQYLLAGLYVYNCWKILIFKVNSKFA